MTGKRFTASWGKIQGADFNAAVAGSIIVQFFKNVPYKTQGRYYPLNSASCLPTIKENKVFAI